MGFTLGKVPWDRIFLEAFSLPRGERRVERAESGSESGSGRKFLCTVVLRPSYAILVLFCTGGPHPELAGSASSYPADRGVIVGRWTLLRRNLY